MPDQLPASGEQPGPTAPLETFDDLWRDAVSRASTSTFLVFSDDHGSSSWTYSEFDAAVEKVSSYLLARHVGPGDAVHLALRNCPAFIVIWLAAARLGAWVVPVDPASSHRDIHHQLARVKAKVGFCGVARADVYREGAEPYGLLVAELDETDRDLTTEDSFVAVAGTSQVLDDCSKPAPQDRLAVLFTSGTTSGPKGVILTQANYATVARTMSAASHLGARDRWFVSLPLFHANAQYYCFAPAIAVRGSVAMTATFSASRWTRQARDMRATHASLFAGPIRMILARTADDAPGCTSATCGLLKVSARTTMQSSESSSAPFRASCMA